MRKSAILIISFMFLLTGCSGGGGELPNIDSATVTEAPTTEEPTTEPTTTESPTEPPTEPPTELPAPDVKELYKSYFLDKYSLTDLVCLADVTHDGIDDMIVIHQDNNDEYVYYGYVYTATDSSVKQIYEKSGTTSHIGGFFNWYLVEDSESWNLAEEYFEMWQGRGETGFRQYYLSNSGEETEVSRIYVPASDDEVYPEGGVTEEAMSSYSNRLGKVIENTYRMFYSYSESSAKPKEIETDPAVIFGIDVPKPEVISYTTAIGKITTDTKMWFERGSESYRQLSEGDSVTIIYENHDKYSPEYFVESDGTYGFVYTDAVSKTGESVTLETTDYFEPLAKYLYTYFYHDTALCYSYYFDCDESDMLDMEVYYMPYVRVKDVTSRNDLLPIIHKQFSSKYDDYDRGRGSINDCLLNADRELFIEQDGKVYALHADGDFDFLNYLSAEYQKTEGNEVWLSMKAEWSSTLTFDFSMLLEDGVWKVGACKYPN